MMAAAEQGDLESVVLWDPVVNGKSYLEALLHLQKETLRFRHKPNYGRKATGAIEVLGFAFPAFLWAELERIDLLAIAQKPAKNVLLIQTTEVAGEDLKSHLQKTEARFEFQRLEAPQIWLPTADGSLLVPSQVLQALVSWILRTHS